MIQGESEARVQGEVRVLSSARMKSMDSWKALAEVPRLRKVFSVRQELASLQVVWRLAELEQLEERLEN